MSFYCNEFAPMLTNGAMCFEMILAISFLIDESSFSVFGAFFLVCHKFSMNVAVGPWSHFAFKN